MENHETRIFTIYSPKGGIGKTTLAVNLAYAYARQNNKVLLVDIAQFGNVGAVLKLNMKSTGLGNILSFFEFADEGDLTEQIKIVKQSVQTFRDDPLEFDVIVSAHPLKMEELDANRLRKTMSILRQIGYDFIIIDTSADICLRNLEAMALSHIIFLLCDQDISSVWNVLMLKDILTGMGLIERLKLILMKENKLSGMTLDEIQTETGLMVFWRLPEEKAVRFYNNQRNGLCKRREQYAIKIKSMLNFLQMKFKESGCDV